MFIESGWAQAGADRIARLRRGEPGSRALRYHQNQGKYEVRDGVLYRTRTGTCKLYECRSQYKEGLNRPLVAMLHNNSNFLRCVCVCVCRGEDTSIYHTLPVLEHKDGCVGAQMFDNICV